jgi:hypothetical protein
MSTKGASLSVAIMAHRKRESYIPALRAGLGRPVQVAWDRINDRWDTGRRALLAYDSSKTHHMVIQDDAVLCRDLPAGVEQALRFTPRDCVVGLYLGRTKAWKPVWMRAQRVQPNLRWVRMQDLMWGVGVVVPTHLIDEIVEIGDGIPEIPNYDSRISAACMKMGIPIWYPWPSMVSHRQSPSLVEGRGWRGRYAYRFLGENASALRYSWDGPAVDVQPPPTSIGRSRSRARQAARRA